MFGFNQAGYYPSARKVFTIDNPANNLAFEIQTIGADVTWKTVLTGGIVRLHGHFVFDFSVVNTLGDYRIVQYWRDDLLITPTSAGPCSHTRYGGRIRHAIRHHADVDA